MTTHLRTLILVALLAPTANCLSKPVVTAPSSGVVTPSVVMPQVGPASTTPVLLPTRYIGCEGKFRIAVAGVQGSLANGAAGPTRVAMRFDNTDGKRHYFTMRSNGDVWASVEPPLSPCDTPNDKTAFATAETWGTGPTGDGVYGSDWQHFPYASHGECDGLPWDGPSCTTNFANLKLDPTTDMMMSFWMEGYAGNGMLGKPTFGASPMNFTTHTFGAFGCWNTNAGLPDQQQGTGMMNVPAWWTAANSAMLPNGNANSLLVGLGGPTGYASTTSMGPSLTLVKAPTVGNDCATADGTYNLGKSKIVENHSFNRNGPVCKDLGCTPTTAPTHPYPARMAFTGYNTAMYAGDWNPWNGVGYFNSATLFGLDWVDNGSYTGIVMPYTTVSGWAIGKILASPAPTFNTTTNIGSFSVDDPSTHDGYRVNFADNIWFDACVTGVDAGCSNANANNRTYGYVLGVTGTSVTGTGPYTISYKAVGLDIGSGTHVPVVGGAWSVGPQYAHGDTGGTLPRLTARLQIVDPNEYVKVLNGTYATTDLPTYTEDVDATTIFPGLGGPATGQGVYAGIGGNAWTWPFNVIADNPRSRIVVAFANEPNCPTYYFCATVYVEKVPEKVQ